jgi:hypothetical protein
MKCELCKRTFYSNEGRFPVSGPTKHHVTPKQFHKRNNYKEEIMMICVACQRQLHRMFTNKELKKMTKEQLLSHSKVIKWSSWITNG